MNLIKFSSVKFSVFLFTVFCLFSLVSEANAQRRDHLTAEEIEIVRDVQEIDKRMLVFVKAVERRFWVLTGTEKLDEKQKKRVKKDLDIWGELPKGTKTQLLSDIDKIIDEAVSKIEDVAERDMKSKLFPIAVHVLSDYAKTAVARLESFSEASKSRREISVINSAVRNLNDIIAAASKVKRPSEKVMKKRTKRIGHTKTPPF